MDFVKISALDDAFEAGLLEAVLNEQDIPHHIRSYADEVYGSLFQTTKGWGSVYAPEEHRDTVKRTLAELRANREEPEGWSE